MDSLMQPAQRIAPSRSRARLQSFEAMVLGPSAGFVLEDSEPSSSSLVPASRPPDSDGSAPVSASSEVLGAGSSPSASSAYSGPRLDEDGGWPMRRPLASPPLTEALNEEPTVVPGLGPLTSQQRLQLEDFLNGAPNSEIDISLLPDLSHLNSHDLWQLGNFLSDDTRGLPLPLGQPRVPAEVPGHGKARWRINEPEFRKLFIGASGAAEDRECAICYQPLHTTCVALPCSSNGCGSFFHGVCIRPWLVRNPSCPLCRGDLGELVKPATSGLRTSDRCPLAEFWLIELEEEASPWLRREREEREEVQAARSAAVLETSRRQSSASASEATAVVAAPVRPFATSPLVVPSEAAPARFSTLISGATRPGSNEQRPLLGSGLPRPPAIQAVAGHGSSRRALSLGSNSGFGSSGIGTSSSFRLRPAGEAILFPGLGQRISMSHSNLL